MKMYVVLFLIGLFSIQASAQKRYTISGYINDAATGETMIGATLNVKGNTRGISSNQYGFYSLTLTEG